MLADAATRLVGARFLLHGRDPAVGLDCVGVLCAALGAVGASAPLPDRYTLRARVPRNLDRVAGACGLQAASLPLRAGDVLLVRVGACQSHLLVATGADTFVHAHAGLRRVVVMAGPLGWPIVGHWRLADVTPVVPN